MLAEYKNKTNIGIGLGIVGQFVGRSLLEAGGSENTAPLFLGVAVILGSVVAFLYGCRSYAIGKGYPPAFGFFGLLSCIGLLVLVFLKDKYPDGVAKAAPPPPSPFPKGPSPDVASPYGRTPRSAPQSAPPPPPPPNRPE